MIVFRKTKNKIIALATNLFQSPQKTQLFGLLGFLFCSCMIIANFVCKLYISAGLLCGLLLCILIILYLDYKGFRRYIRMAYVLSLNFFSILVVTSHGLAAGGYLFFIVLLVALAFLLENVNNYRRQVFRYFAITIVSFLICISYSPTVSKWEYIPPSLYQTLFIVNCATAIILISLFSFFGVTLERKARHALVLEKNRAKSQADRISEQNKHLRNIAFMSAHTVRAPLTNIMSITRMLDPKEFSRSRDEKLIQFLKVSANDLDKVIREIVEMTSSVEAEINDSSSNNWII